MVSPTLPVDALAVLAQLQDQIDELHRTVTAQQDTIDRLVAQHTAHWGGPAAAAAETGAGKALRDGGER